LPEAAALKSPQSADDSPVSTPDQTRKIIMSTDIQAIPRETRESARLFNCLGNPARLNLLCLLAAEGEMFVGQMCEKTGHTQPSLSSQLRILRVNGLVEVRREGVTKFYSLVDGFESIASRVQSAVDTLRKISLKEHRTKRSTK
jgi:DNA-binding transcriptional ArsR family regulator